MNGKSEFTRSIDGGDFIRWVMREVYKVTSLAALSKRWKTDQAYIGKIRSNRANVPAWILLQVHEDTGIPTKEIRAIVALRPAVSDHLPTTKRCGKCGEVKPLSEFHNRAESKDQKAASCKCCAISATKLWAANFRNRISNDNSAPAA